MEKVSIIVPVYNSEKYIGKTIESLCNQDYPDIEIILVNDGTKDNSIEIAEDVLNEHKRGFSVIDQENRGLASARNTGFRSARGKYICFIDSDDIIDKHHVSTLVNIIEQDKIEIAFSKFEITKEKNRIGTECALYDRQLKKTDDVRKEFMKRETKIHACALMMTKEFLENLDGPFAEGLRYGEDADFIWRALYQCDMIGCTNAQTYKYLVRPNSLMTTYDVKKIKAFFERFGNTIHNLQVVHKDDSTMLGFGYDRVVFAQLRSMAKCTSYTEFLRGCKEIDFSTSLKRLKTFPDGRVRLLSKLFMISPLIFWRVNH